VQKQLKAPLITSRSFREHPWLLDKTLDEGRPHDFVLYRDFLWTLDEDLRFEDGFSAKVQVRLEEEWQRVTHDDAEPVPARARLSEAVRHQVWRRDGGKCTHCGSRENLEYDHIIPVSMGGGNTARNIELLCESCNRQKGAALSVGNPPS
jgi:HNH endonuclease